MIDIFQGAPLPEHFVLQHLWLSYNVSTLQILMMAANQAFQI